MGSPARRSSSPATPAPTRWCARPWSSRTCRCCPSPSPRRRSWSWWGAVPMGPARPRPSALGVVDEELRARAWRGAVAGVLVIALAELAYVFIDYEVFHGLRLPVLRALHALWALLLLG